MIDTVKLELAIFDPLALDGERFYPLTIRQLVMSAKIGAMTGLVPSRVYKGVKEYMPCLTVYKRATKLGAPLYILAVEFSAPKLLYGNNFDELTEDDLEPLLDALGRVLEKMVGVRFSREQLLRAGLTRWDVSKNIVFRDYTSCLTALNVIAKLDVSRMYDLQNTTKPSVDVRDGHITHIHCNSLDIAFYDKMADLRQATKSEKRAIEHDSAIQLQLLETLQKPFEILRYEVRLNGRAAIKRTYPELDSWTLETMFKVDKCKQLLLGRWQKLTGSVDMLALDSHKPYELLQNYLINNPDVTPQTAMAAVTGLLIAGQQGTRGLRALLETRYGNQAWYRLKPLLKTPTPNRFKHINHITDTLNSFEPTRISNYQERL